MSPVKFCYLVVVDMEGDFIMSTYFVVIFVKQSLSQLCFFSYTHFMCNSCALCNTLQGTIIYAKKI